MRDIQNNEKIQKSARYLIVEWAWIASFAIGSIMLALAIIGVPFQDGTQSTVGVVTCVIPAYFGPPATLLSVVLAPFYRPNLIRHSLTLLLAQILVFALHFVIGAIACC